MEGAEEGAVDEEGEDGGEETEEEGEGEIEEEEESETATTTEGGSGAWLFLTGVATAAGTGAFRGLASCWAAVFWGGVKTIGPVAAC